MKRLNLDDRGCAMAMVSFAAVRHDAGRCACSPPSIDHTMHAPVCGSVKQNVIRVHVYVNAIRPRAVVSENDAINSEWVRVVGRRPGKEFMGQKRLAHSRVVHTCRCTMELMIVWWLIAESCNSSPRLDMDAKSRWEMVLVVVDIVTVDHQSHGIVTDASGGGKNENGDGTGGVRITRLLMLRVGSQL